MKFMKRAGRKESIIVAFLLHREKWGTTFMTQYDVAKKIDLAPSNYLMGILMEMVEDGELKVHEVEHRKGVNKRLFSLSRKYANQLATDFKSGESGAREIVVNSKAGQMRLAL